MGRITDSLPGMAARDSGQETDRMREMKTANFMVLLSSSSVRALVQPPATVEDTASGFPSVVRD